MRSASAFLLPFLLFTACGEQVDDTPLPEDGHVTAQHVLIAFRGSMRSSVRDRTRDEAATLAADILARAEAGEDFGALMKEFSNDPGGGVYTMADLNIRPKPGAFPRSQMAPAFGDVAFSLAVGEVGLAEYDAVASPFGYHIIQRVE